MTQSWLAQVTTLTEFPLLIQLSIVIIGLDALSTIPFARLRYEGKPRLFAFIKISSIVINVGFTVFFLSYCPAKAKEDPYSWATLIYRPDINPITYVLLANVMQSLFTLICLGKWVLPKQWKFNFVLWTGMMIYTLPMLIAGLGGMINETFDRLMLGWWLPGSHEF